MIDQSSLLRFSGYLPWESCVFSHVKNMFAAFWISHCQPECFIADTVNFGKSSVIPKLPYIILYFLVWCIYLSWNTRVVVYRTLPIPTYDPCILETLSRIFFSLPQRNLSSCYPSLENKRNVLELVLDIWCDFFPPLNGHWKRSIFWMFSSNFVVFKWSCVFFFNF